VPVHARHQIQESIGHREVAQIRRPDLVRLIDGQAPQSVGIDLVAFARFAGPGLGIQGLKTHQPHPALHPFAVDSMTSVIQLIPYTAAALKW